MVNKTAYQRVQGARRKDKISTAELIHGLTTDFFELHGDRLEADDHALIGGVGLLNNRPITVVGIQKGADTDENIDRHFGSSTPQGYRKALRLMKQAENSTGPFWRWLIHQVPGQTWNPNIMVRAQQLLNVSFRGCSSRYLISVSLLAKVGVGELSPWHVVIRC